MMNLWLLSEERPRVNVISEIVKLFCTDNNYAFSSNQLKIKPIIRDNKFTFVYIVEGIQCKEINNIYIKIVGGNSSFVDYLVFFQQEEPSSISKPIYAIEETKTDDSESRNTGVYQRCSKFVFISFYYPNVKKIMLYNLRVGQKFKPTMTNIFGTRMLATIGVVIIGKKSDKNINLPFNNIDELIEYKNQMRTPPGDNVPIKITKYDKTITISGKLLKNGSLSHDPNIGALTMIAYCLRKLGWDKKLLIIDHGLSQNHVGKNNKFIKISNEVGIDLQGVNVPLSKLDQEYWHYELSSEKVATIFIHIVIENYTNGSAIYENHAGCERGYLYDKDGYPQVIPKYQEGLRNSYKDGNKKAIISIPDLIVYDTDRDTIVDMEGKRYKTRNDGIEELRGYSYIENSIIKPIYKPKSIVRTVIVFGSTNNEIEENDIGFILNNSGEMVVNNHAPEIIKEAINSLKSF